MRVLSIAAMIATLALPAWAGELERGDRIFLDEMTPEMQGFIASEISRQDVPVTITRDRSSADYILVGVSEIHKRNWKRAIFGGRPDTGTATLYDRETEDVLWSASAGGRSYLKGDFKSMKRIAKKLVKDLRKTFF